MMLSVAWDADAQEELRRLPSAERRAVMTAAAKLEAFGDQLGAPHSSQVKGSHAGIRELRPRAGRSPWRVLYRRVGGTMVRRSETVAACQACPAPQDFSLGLYMDSVL